MNHRTTIRVGDRHVETLADILPRSAPIRMLIVAKTPAPVSVAAGHYFQGQQGRMFWNRLRDYGLLEAPAGSFQDDALIAHGYGLTDIVKVPRDYGSEPSNEEYREGTDRILELAARLQPQVLLFVYKRVLDQILRVAFDHPSKASYGFNPELDPHFGCRVFVFPMPGTPCTSAQAIASMSQLADSMA